MFSLYQHRNLTDAFPRVKPPRAKLSHFRVIRPLDSAIFAGILSRSVYSGVFQLSLRRRMVAQAQK